MDLNHTIEDFKKIILEKFPDDTSKLELIFSLLGSSITTTEFIRQNFDLKKLSQDMQYACALAAENIAYLIYEKEYKFFHEPDYERKEVNVQVMRESFNKIVPLLYGCLDKDKCHEK